MSDLEAIFEFNLCSCCYPCTGIGPPTSPNQSLTWTRKKGLHLSEPLQFRRTSQPPEAKHNKWLHHPSQAPSLEPWKPAPSPASKGTHWAPGPMPLLSKSTVSSCRPLSPAKAVATALAPSLPQGQGSQNPSFIAATDAKDLHNPSTEQFGSKNSFPSGSNDPPHVHEQNSQASSISEITRLTRAHKQHEQPTPNPAHRKRRR